MYFVVVDHKGPFRQIIKIYNSVACQSEAHALQEFNISYNLLKVVLSDYSVSTSRTYINVDNKLMKTKLVCIAIHKYWEDTTRVTPPGSPTIGS